MNDKLDAVVRRNASPNFVIGVFVAGAIAMSALAIWAALALWPFKPPWGFVMSLPFFTGAVGLASEARQRVVINRLLNEVESATRHAATIDLEVGR